MINTPLSIQVVVVEDDPNLNADLLFFLRKAGMAAHGVNTAHDLETHLETYVCDVVLLDLGLPDEDGLNVARRLMEKPDLGLVMLTARGSLQDRLDGWRSGAQVYLVKPTPLPEVVAVVEAVYRRLRPLGHDSQIWRWFPQRRELHTPNGSIILLTHRENLVIRVLSDAPNQHIPRDLMLSQHTGAALDSLIHRLRRKLKTHGDPLRTVYGSGYAFMGKLLKVGI